MGIVQMKMQRIEKIKGGREKSATGTLLYPEQSFQQVLHQPSTFCTAKQRQRQK